MRQRLPPKKQQGQENEKIYVCLTTWIKRVKKSNKETLSKYRNLYMISNIKKVI